MLRSALAWVWCVAACGLVIGGALAYSFWMCVCGLLLAVGLVAWDRP